MFDFLSGLSMQASHLLPLQIFPGSMSSSVITTVWVGIFVVALFNLRFGWVMSGLIVPGYLVPLLLVKPSAALVVLGEGMITYFLVWFYSEWLSQRMLWSRFFGRDRFFVLVLASVAVRIVGDGFVLPLLGQYLNDHWQIQFDYQNNLHSFGLIIAALVANNFWKTGLTRGLFATVVTVGLTYCIVRFGLMEYTNFSMSNIGYLYEDMASSFLASPKSYIILIITAFVASRMNLYYGWDFSGILIPSLLALQWFAPQKILMSFLEAIVILLLAHLVLQAPVFKRITVEGARKILLFFNISFAYKMALGWIILYFWPGIKISDYYGFGYLLPTLMALKMHDKGIFARMSAAILQTSLGASALAALLGFGLSLLPDPVLLLQSRQITPGSVHPRQFDGKALDLLLAQKPQAYQSLTKTPMQKPSPLQSQAFDAALHLLQHDTLTPQQLDQAAALLQTAQYELQQNGDMLLLLERAPQQYRGSFLINRAAKRALMIEVPLPIDEAGTFEAGAALFEQLDARVLAVAGAARHAAPDGGTDVLAFPNTTFQAFHRAFARKNTLQVRAVAVVDAATAGNGNGNGNGKASSVLRIKGDIPFDLPLPVLQQQLGKLAISWQAAPGMNIQRDSVANGFAQLELDPQHLRQLLLASHPAQATLAGSSGNIRHVLMQDKQQFAATGSNLYRAPTAGELIYLDKDVLTPLAAVLGELAKASANASAQASASAANKSLLSPDMQQRLQMINLAAQALGYQLSQFEGEQGERYLLLQELAVANGQTRRYWGSVAFRLGTRQPFLVQVPRPYFDPNSLEMGIALFDRLQAGAIGMAGASPLANQDRSADLLNFQNKGNLLNLVGQVMLREAGAKPWMTLQTRALSLRPGVSLPASDLLLSFGNGSVKPEQASSLGRQLLQTLQQDGFGVQFADGNARVAEYGAAAAMQTQYQSASRNKEVAMLWTSQLASPELRQQTLPTAQNMQFKALGIPVSNASLATVIAGSAAAAQDMPPALRSQLDAYLQKQDVVLMHELKQQYTDLGFEYLVDSGSHRGYLLVWQASKDSAPAGNAGAQAGSPRRWLAVLNLSAKDPARVQSGQTGQDMTAQARAFIGNNMTWWLARSKS